MGKDRLGWTYLVRASKAVSMLRSSRHDLIGDVGLAEEVVPRLLDQLEIGLFGSMMYAYFP